MIDDRVGILIVDDTEDNLVAVEAILEPLGHDLVLARSGEEALKHLLTRDFAVILLDVQMPGLDGFETAALIKQRERTRRLPIIFLTAISKDEQQVFRGYSAGAVDYLFKPFDPEVLRSKVAVFVELHQKNLQLQRQAEQLRLQELAELRRESEERYQQLADAMPQIVWTSDTEGRASYFNRRWFEYTGMAPEEADPHAWTRVVHPDDLAETVERWQRTLTSGEVFEVEYRFRDEDGIYRWHLGRAVPIRGEDGQIALWVGTATDIDDRKRAEEAQRFLLDAGTALAGSLDYRQTLASVARLAVPRIADWCTVHVLEEGGAVRQLEVAHADPAKVVFARELQERYPVDLASPTGIGAVIRSRRPELVTAIPEERLGEAARDELHLGLLRELGFRSYICVPLTVRDRVLGAVTLVAAESGRTFTDADLHMAEELARRAATAMDNSHLYRQAEERAQAARVLATVGDGVFLLDAAGTIRLWNRAAEAITGLREEAVLGRRAADILPGWAALAPRVPVASAPGPVAVESVPLDVGDRELWLSISGVGFEDGTVYAFRDLSVGRAFEELRQDLVATVSHELRTPLAAIYGSALTLRRGDLELDEGLRGKLLAVISEESSRLAEIVNDLLLASQLDSGRLDVRIERCDPQELVASVVDSAQTHVPDNVQLRFRRPATPVPDVEADRGQLRQVLDNLIENAVKYSPEGGPVEVSLEPAGGKLRFAVADRGLGIPAPERQRIFDKFYRLDPHMAHGVGGTGLGLYICRELVRRMDGRIWVESDGRRGSTFVVELPVA